MLRTSANIPTHDPLANRSQSRIIDGLTFDWAMLVFGTIFLSGLYLDGWAHNHGRVDNSFFTVWHAFFYAGFGLVMLLLLGTLLWNRAQGMRWRSALPNGYQLALLGVFIFAAGGVGDLIWHELFGIEEDFEALISPTHLMLGAGLGLIVSGPLRAALARPHQRPTWREIAPALVATAALISAFTFGTPAAVFLSGSGVLAYLAARNDREAGQVLADAVTEPTTTEKPVPDPPATPAKGIVPNMDLDDYEDHKNDDPAD